MKKINFNNKDFKGFIENEDILLDSCVILALLNFYDAWHDTVSALFDEHIFNSDNTVFLYVNPLLIDEVTHIIDKPAKEFADIKGLILPIDVQEKARTDTTSALREMIEKEVLIILEGTKSSVLKQLSLYETLGSADAAHASLANEYGISLLTVDNKLVNNIFMLQEELKDINNVYFTTPEHRTDFKK